MAAVAEAGVGLASQDVSEGDVSGEGLKADFVYCKRVARSCCLLYKSCPTSVRLYDGNHDVVKLSRSRPTVFSVTPWNGTKVEGYVAAIVEDLNYTT